MSLIILFFVIVQERASICFRLSSTNTAMRNVFYLVVLVVLLAHWQRLRAIGSFFLPFFSETFALCFRGNFLFIIIVYLSWLDVLFKIFILKCNRICGAYRLQLPSNTGTINCILSKWAWVDLYTSSLDCPLFVFFCTFEFTSKLGS